MKITAVEEYGLRCVLALAAETSGRPLSLTEIASREGLTVPHVGKLMAILREASLVDSVRGRGGGYALARPAHKISVEEVLGALGEPLFATGYCESHPGSLDVCTRHTGCSIRSVWQLLGGMIHDVLARTSIADLLMQEEQLAQRLAETTPPRLIQLGSGPTGIGADAPACAVPIPLSE